MRSAFRLPLALAFLLSGVAAAQAHEVRPAYLELRQTGAETYDVLWKVPARGDDRLDIEPRLSEGCATVGPVARQVTADAAVSERSTVRCADGLAERTVAVDGLAATMTDVLVRVQRLDGTTQAARLTPAAPSFVVEAAPTLLGTAWAYFGLGVEHILGGADHLLFVLGLLLLVEDRRALVGTITAFTAAHSVTLAVAALGLAQVPSAPVEASIALSILFLGPEIVRRRRGGTSLTIRRPWLVASAFGLLHGLGFAGGLSVAGLPPPDIPVALLLFNLGVEAGQLLFIALVLALGHRCAAPVIRWQRWAEAIPGYAVGIAGAFWALERTAALLGAGSG